MTDKTTQTHDPLNPHGLTESDCPAGSACKEVHCLVHGPGGVLDRAREASDEPDTKTETPDAKKNDQ